MGFTLGRARRGNPCQSVFKLTGSHWPSPHHTQHSQSREGWIVMTRGLLIGHGRHYWPLIDHRGSPGSPGRCCRGWWSAASPDTRPSACLKQKNVSDWDLLLSFITIVFCPERQEVNYCRLNEFVNNAFRPTPELYCKRNFLKIIARLTQLMIQIVANWDKSCQFF